MPHPALVPNPHKMYGFSMRDDHRLHVLLVDDDFDLRRLIAEYLRVSGIAVATAADGLVALELLSRSPALDAIVLDLAMPVMDGAQFLTQLRSTPGLARTPVILITGMPQPPACAFTPVRRWFVKPFKLEELLEEIHAAARSRREACA
jgi:CheY-like chemotaxis protein